MPIECPIHGCEAPYVGMQNTNKDRLACMYRCYAGRHGILVVGDKVITDVQEQTELLR